MNTIVLITLFTADFILLGIVYFSLRKPKASGADLAEMMEERNLLQQMRDEIRAELESTSKLSKTNILEISRLSGEVEQEIKNSGQQIAQGVEAIVSEMGAKLHPTLQELQEHRNALEMLSRKLERQKLTLEKTLDRAESFTKYLSGAIPADEILRDLETKKYSDARHLLSQGFTTDQVAKELGLHEQEVRLILTASN